jgi:Integrase core domain.
MGGRSRWEYFRAIFQRYREALVQEKGKILDEFCRVCGYSRKYAIRKLSGPPPGAKPERRRGRRKLLYGSQVISVLREVWEASGYPWSVRLKAMLPVWMPWIRKRFGTTPEVERQLLSISARQMDRRLSSQKRRMKRRLYGRTKPGTLLKHQIPIRTDHWDVKAPGFTEVDLVSHSGNCGDGEFLYSLNLTDIFSGWVETRAILGKDSIEVRQALEGIREVLPFPLRGIDSDNGSEFINKELFSYCTQQEIQLTRGRPYKKDDNAHIEQKNWTHVRKLLGWDRYDSQRAGEAINDLYGKDWRWMMNLFCPSVKLLDKKRVGSKLLRKYDAAQTPLDRLVASGQGDGEKLQQLLLLRSRLDPFQLAGAVDRKIERIGKLANHRQSPRQPQERAASGKGNAERRNGGRGRPTQPKIPTTALKQKTERISQARMPQEGRSATPPRARYPRNGQLLASASPQRKKKNARNATTRAVDVAENAARLHASAHSPYYYETDGLPS